MISMSMLETPLELASHSNQWETMKVLLKDPRVNIDNRDIHGRGFLFWTSDKNHIESVQLVLATRPDIIVQDRDIPDMSNESVDLLKSYQLDPESTRHGLLTRLGYIERFFSIAERLPLDLQMVLSNRIFGSEKDVIISKDSGVGFCKMQ